MTKCRKQTGCAHDKTDKCCCDDCRKKKTACSKCCDMECKKEKETCKTCKNLKNAYIDEINYAMCENAKKYNITCTAAKCPEWEKEVETNA